MARHLNYKHPIKQFAQWALRKELAQAQKSYHRVERELTNTKGACDNLYGQLREVQEELAGGRNLLERLHALQKWQRDEDYLHHNNLLSFTLEYLHSRPKGVQFHGIGVHPAQRWGIGGGGDGFEVKYGRSGGSSFEVAYGRS